MAVLENKKFGKGCFKPYEHILYLIFFLLPNHGRQHNYFGQHSLSVFCPGFLINQVGTSVFGWLWSKMDMAF